jgi:hypothetical protein
VTSGLRPDSASRRWRPWRLTHLLAEEDGPGDMVIRARAALGDGPAGELMDCFYCLSVWVAAPASLAVARRGRDLPFTWLGRSVSHRAAHAR